MAQHVRNIMANIISTHRRQTIDKQTHTSSVCQHHPLNRPTGELFNILTISYLFLFILKSLNKSYLNLKNFKTKKGADFIV